MPALPPTLGFLGRHPAIRRILASILASVATAACMTWRRMPERPDALLARHPETVLRVARRSGEQVEFKHPFVVPDSIGGLVRHDTDLVRATIPLADVAWVEVHRVSAGRTALLVGAVGVTAVAIASAANSAPSPPARVTTSGDYGISSCPFVYSWDGKHWRLDSGTFGGAIARALQRTDVDNLDYALPEDGLLRLKLANELPETDHVDQLAVLAVEHDPDVVVAPDPSGGLHTVGALTQPFRATDFGGGDALARVRDLDGWNWESRLAPRDTTRTADLTDGLELAFVRPRGATLAHLVLDGNNSVWSTHLLNEFVRLHGAATEAWYDSLDAYPVLVQALAARFAAEAYLQVAVRTGDGWVRQGTFGGVGPEAAKRQVLEVDLSQVRGDTVLVRLESAPSFWLVDRVAMSFSADRNIVVTGLPLVSAVDQAGRDVAPELAAIDGRTYDLRSGDAAELTFRVPVLPAGRSRTFILRSTGWYRVDSPETGEPDVATLDAVARDPHGIARGSVARINTALADLAEHRR